MKFIFVLCALILVSCVNSQKTYMCGNKECLDKKEFKEFFAKNLIIEIKKREKKNSSIDLVKLNTESSENKKNLKIKKSKIKNVNKKEARARLIGERKKLKEKRKKIKEENKLNKILKKKRLKDEKKLVKLNKTNKNKLIKLVEPIDKENTKNETLKKFIKKNNKKNLENNEHKYTKSIGQINICEEIKDCDIDKVTEILIKKGRIKSFPDISK